MLCLFVLSSLGLSWLSCFDSGPCTCHIQGFLDICIQHIQWLALELEFLFENCASLARGWLFYDLCVSKFTFYCELMEVFRLVRQLRLPSGKQHWTCVISWGLFAKVHQKSMQLTVVKWKSLWDVFYFALRPSFSSHWICVLSVTGIFTSQK